MPRRLPRRERSTPSVLLGALSESTRESVVGGSRGLVLELIQWPRTIR